MVISKFHSSFIVTIFIAFLIISGSCNINENEPEKAPKLPPENSLKIDFSFFKSAESGLKYENNNNWLFARNKVLFWDTLISESLAVPENVIPEISDIEPIYDLGSWFWADSIVVDDVEYAVNLFGTVENLKIVWDMYFSKDGYYNDFLWVKGNQSISDNYGQWMLSKSYAENFDFLQIDWTLNSENEINTLKFTSLVPDTLLYNSYIFFENNLSGDYNCFFEIFDAKDSSSTIINWNTQNNKGCILLNDSVDWLCWDEYFYDTDCKCK